MNPITLQEVLDTTGALSDRNPSLAARLVRLVRTDSRSVEPGDLFVALRGERFDAHDFLADVAAAGAAAAVVERDVPEAPLPLIRVENARVALGQIAQLVRQSFGGKVVAVAGSNGKTGTKRLIDAALRGRLRGTISPASFNNDVGVPLSIFPAHPADDYLVLEMGTNHPGEIAPLSIIGGPDIAVITNCGPEHLEGLIDLDGVRRENAQVTAGLRPDGLLIVNGDDPALLDAVGGWTGRRVTFGLSEGVDYRAVEMYAGAAGVRFRVELGSSNPTPRLAAPLAGGVAPIPRPASGAAERRGPAEGETAAESVEVFVPLVGEHHAVNALAAIAVGRELGLTAADLAAGLATATGAGRRSELRHIGPIALLDDCYNANPASMAAALRTLAALPTGGRRIAVLGEMRELGEESAAFHREVGRQAGFVDELVCVGEMARHIAAGAGVASVRVVADARGAAEVLVPLVRAGDLVLLKGSRGVGLEVVTAAVERAFGK